MLDCDSEDDIMDLTEFVVSNSFLPEVRREFHIEFVLEFSPRFLTSVQRTLFHLVVGKRRPCLSWVGLAIIFVIRGRTRRDRRRRRSGRRTRNPVAGRASVLPSITASTVPVHVYFVR